MEIPNINNNNTTITINPLYKTGSISNAKLHSLANRPYHLPSPLPSTTQFCNCCQLPLPSPTNNIIPLQCCTSNINYLFLGIGTFLYFDYLIYCVFSISFFILTNTIPSLTISHSIYFDIKSFCMSNTNTNFTCPLQASSTTNSSIINWIYIYNYNLINSQRRMFMLLNTPTYVIDLCIIGIIICIGLTLLNIGFIVLMYMKVNILQYKATTKTASMFTVMISNLNTLITKYYPIYELQYQMMKHSDTSIMNINDNDLFINFIFDDIITNSIHLNNNDTYKWKDSISVVNIAYKLNEFNMLNKKLQKYKLRLYKMDNYIQQINLNQQYGYYNNNTNYSECYFKKRKCCSCCLHTKQTRINIINTISTLQNEIDIKRNSLTQNFAGVLFISFKSLNAKNMFINGYSCSYYNKLIYICKCCCCYNNKHKRYEILSYMNIASAPEPQDIIWNNLEFNITKRICYGIKTYLISIVVVIISFICVSILNYIQDVIDNNNSNTYIIGYCISLLISITIAIINNVIEIILEKFTYFEKKHTHSDYYVSYSFKLTIFLFCNTALIPYFAYLLWKPSFEYFTQSILMIYISHCLLSPLLWLINVKYILTTIKRKLCMRLLLRRQTYSQSQLNSLYERPPMKMYVKVSYVTVMLFLTSFYASVFPLGAVIAVIGVTCAYFVEKYNIANVYKRPICVDEKVCLFHVCSFKYCIVLYCVGNVLFVECYTVNIASTLVYCALAVFVGVFQFGNFCERMVNMCMKKDSNSGKWEYDKEFFRFGKDYQRENPVTKKEGVMFYLNKLRVCGLISDEDYDIAVSKCEKGDDVNLMELYYKGKKVKSEETITVTVSINEGERSMKGLMDNTNIKKDTHSNHDSITT